MDEGQSQEHRRAGQHEPEAAAKRDRHHQPDDGDEDRHLERRIVGEEVGSQLVTVQQVGPEPCQLVPGHVVQVVPLPPEGQYPEGRAEPGDQTRGEHPPQRPTARSHGQGDSRCHQRVEHHEQVEQPGEGQHDRCGATTPARLKAPDHEADVDEACSHGQSEGELACHGRHQVAAHDVERPVEHEWQGGHRCQGRARERQAGEAPRQPSGHRHDHQAADRHPLQRHAVVDRYHQHGERSQQDQAGDPAGGPVAEQACCDEADGGDRDHEQRRCQADVDGHDQQHRDHHVEVVGGEPRVPVGCPPGEAEPG